MQPLITQKPEMLLVGMSFYGDPFSTHGGWEGENEIGRVWTRLMKFLEQNPDGIHSVTQPGVFYEVHIYNQETPTKGVFEVFVGVQIDQLQEVPVDLLVKVLPASQYAVFTLEGEEISSDWYQSIDQWIAEAGYQRANSFFFQYYDQRFKGVDRIEESILDIYMPVIPGASPAN